MRRIITLKEPDITEKILKEKVCFKNRFNLFIQSFPFFFPRFTFYQEIESGIDSRKIQFIESTDDLSLPLLLSIARSHQRKWP